MSIVLPAWNAAATLPSALASIQRQTYDDWECVVVDDGSTDTTRSIVAGAAAADPRIRLIAAPHRGLVEALNEGLSASRGVLIARMDADDLMHRQRLALQTEALSADASLAAVGSHVRIFPRSGMRPRLREYEGWLNSLRTAADVTRDAFVECPVVHPTLLMRREMAQMRYCARGWPEDYDLVLRALARGLRIAVVARRLLAWRDRAESWSRTSADYDLERFTACKARYLADGFLAGVQSYVLWGYGDTGRTLRRALALHDKTPSHIVEVKASRLGQRIHGAPVIPRDRLRGLRGIPIVVSVARAGPRQEIRSALTAMDFIDGADYVCAA